MLEQELAVTTTPGLGSVYLANYTDNAGDWLEGGNYRISLGQAVC